MDNNRGYEPDNCVPCCDWCNSIKKERSIAEMRERLADILKTTG